jgi:DNA (cytosine-5)-methyltransferase 1
MLGLLERRETMDSSTEDSTRCSTCTRDRDFLAGTTRPDYETGRAVMRLVDLFAGCGGLTLGAAEAARRRGLGVDIGLAVDNDDVAIEVYQSNFPNARAKTGNVEDLFDGRLGEEPTQVESRLADAVGFVDVLLGGPPCQGHSDLNNHTRRSDKRNGLYVRMARAAQVLKPSVLLTENVPAVVHAHEQVVQATVDALKHSGYNVEHGVLDLADLGVPQRRRRHVLVAYKGPTIGLLAKLGRRCCSHPRDLRWAIADLEDRESDLQFDTSSKASAKNENRIAWLFENDRYDLPNDLRPKCHQGEHSYVSMYGRLAWSTPPQTITTGFGSMGQGRYVHPTRRRTLTPHEAARIQLIPDFFDFSAARTRSGLAQLIGNAVPPALATEVLSQFPLTNGEKLGD